MKIFDFHTHVFPDHLAERALLKLAYGAHVQPETDGTLSGTVDYMRREGMDGFLTLHIATTQKQQTHVNDFAIAVQESGAAQAFGSFYPGSGAAEAIERIAVAGLKGVKLHPEYQGYDFDDRAVYPFYELCRDHDLTVVMHAGFDPAYLNSLRAPVLSVKHVAEDIKGLRIVAAHFGGFLLAQEAAEVLAGKAEVYLDTGCSVGFVARETAEKIIKRHGAERILFGSDCPWGSPSAHFRFIDGLNITDREKELIFYQNAKRLLDLKE